jgi:hypothetical protein
MRLEPLQNGFYMRKPFLSGVVFTASFILLNGSILLPPSVPPTPSITANVVPATPKSPSDGAYAKGNAPTGGGQNSPETTVDPRWSLPPVVAREGMKPPISEIAVNTTVLAISGTAPYGPFTSNGEATIVRVGDVYAIGLDDEDIMTLKQSGNVCLMSAIFVQVSSDLPTQEQLDSCNPFGVIGVTVN